MSDPLPFLAPTIMVLPWSGLCQGPADGDHGKDPRNELLFFLPRTRTLVAGDTFFVTTCGVLQPVVSFNPQGLAMVKDLDQVRGTVTELLTRNFDNLIPIHGSLGSMIMNDAKSMVQNATNLFF
eukprot:TRINITY_DN4434_c0_g2_i1.p1 TRINITY_DN4434_c0_g2~~TRINITY_DN4434_c0_g2_i1.p1  ORF type:complete len:124 (+),score=15.94 TRINITY_DN4434_c0_g2_i1:602-973(+)